MAQNNAFTINVSNVAVYTAVRDAVKPTVNLATFNFSSPPATLGTAPAVHGLLGHTSENTEISLTPDITGGERLGSKQVASLRRTPRRVAWSLAIAALQGDNTVLSFVFGGGNVATVGEFGVPKNFDPADVALLVLMADSQAALGLRIPLAEITPSGAIEFGAAALTEFGLTCSILDSNADSDLMRFYRSGLGAAA